MLDRCLVLLYYLDLFSVRYASSRFLLVCMIFFLFTIDMFRLFFFVILGSGRGWEWWSKTMSPLEEFFFAFCLLGFASSRFLFMSAKRFSFYFCFGLIVVSQFIVHPANLMPPTRFHPQRRFLKGSALFFVLHFLHVVSFKHASLTRSFLAFSCAL